MPVDHGRLIRPGERDLAGVEGEVCVKSPGVMKGYYNNPEATAKVLSPDGWLRTGDLGLIDADGHLFITGRLKDVIILGGANVVPVDIEEVVDSVPGVRYSAAVGLDNERSGTQRLHVVAEVRAEELDEAGSRGLVREIVNRVHRASGHRPARVLLVKSGTISFNADESPFNWVDLFAAGPATVVSWTSSYSDTGVLGDAELATPEKGRQAYEEAVKQLVRLVTWFKDRPKDVRKDRHRTPPTFPMPWNQRPV